MWFAPNLTMTGVFTGTVGIALGLDFSTALVAVVLGTLLGAVPTAYLGTWGARPAPDNCRSPASRSAGRWSSPAPCSGCRPSPGTR